MSQLNHRTEIKANVPPTATLAAEMTAVSTGKTYDVPISKGMFARIVEMSIDAFSDAEVRHISIMDNNDVELLVRCECSSGSCTCVVESCGSGQSITCSCSNSCSSNNFYCS